VVWGKIAAFSKWPQSSTFKMATCREGGKSPMDLRARRTGHLGEKNALLKGGDGCKAKNKGISIVEVWLYNPEGGVLGNF